MRVAIFTGTYLKDKDGVARSLYELVRSLKTRGHEVGIWSPEISLQVEEGVSTFPLPSVPIPLYPHYKMTIFFKDVFKELKEFSPDIIQISTPDLIAAKFLKYARLKDIPVVSVYHTDFPSYLKYYRLDMLEGAVWRELVRFYNKCDVIFTPTYEMKRLLEGKRINKVEVWSRGIRSDLFHPSQRSDKLREVWGAKGKKVVLYVGRFVKYKELELVTELYRRIRQEGRDDLKFVLVGSGPMEDELKERMEDAVFPGYLHGNELYRSYASGDIFLFPSSTEAFGNVVQEAISSGLPSIVSDKGGCQEIVRESGAGIICKAGDVWSFYEGLIKLSHDTDLYSKCRDKGLSWSKDQTWKKINEKMITKLEDLIEEKRETTISTE